MVKVKPIANAKPQQIIKADEVAISVENITKNQQHVVELKNADDFVIQSQKLAKKELDSLAALYNNKNIHPKDFTISINGKTLVADKSASTGAPVFQCATDADVMAYFKNLSEIDTMPAAQIIPGKGIVYSIKITFGPNAGSRMALRDFSKSASQTNAKWTIDIQNPNINNGRPVEMKFQ